MSATKKQNEAFIISIFRMSQKALMVVLALIGVGYLGGMISILFDQSLAQPMAEFTKIFIPLFQLEIGVYGFGSTLENIQKIKGQIESINKKNDKEEPNDAEGTEKPSNG
jgi:hypothetical protein